MSQPAPVTYVYDIETYPNFFLAVFKEVNEGRDKPFIKFTWARIKELKRFLAEGGLLLAGYNNRDFDDQILAAIVEGVVETEADVARVATRIIEGDESVDRRWWAAKGITWASVDLMQILGGRGAGSLKSHEVRLGLPNVVDLPIEPGAMLSAAQKKQITLYCENDVDATLELYFDTLSNIAVREEINERYPHLRGSALVRSNASIAESVIREELVNRAGFRRDRLVKPGSFSFDPANDIDPVIRFVEAANQEVLARLRAHRSFDPVEWRGRLAKNFRFRIGKHTLELGSGGLHTLIGPVCVRSVAILEFDVASYYPNLLRKIDRAPAGLPDQWIDIVNELTDRRVVAKREGRKSEAEVYKIVINSLYGKLAEQFSINLDLSLQLQVVLNGQLFLIMLLEQFNAAGIEVIAANTDGLYIDAGDKREQAERIAAEWQAATGFVLESKSCTIYVATGVNDYALYEPTRGWFHKKGRLGPGKRTRPVVIPNAALEHIATGREVGSIVRQTTDIRDFLFSYSSKVGRVRSRGKDLQKTNRWYRSVDGALLEVHSSSEARQPKKVPNSDNAVVANALSSLARPSDIDLEFYAAEAVALADEVLRGSGESIRATKTIVDRAADARARFGFVVVPKGWYGQEKAVVKNAFDQHTIDYWRSVSLHEAKWVPFEGFGAYTGPDFAVLAIDIDDPDKANKAGVFKIIGDRGLAVWHGKGTAGDVRAGRKRGTIIFACDADTLRTTGGRFLIDYGFEILYGGKVVQLAGFHKTREQYRFAGKLDPIPAELLRQLEWMTPERAIPDLDDAAPLAEGVVDRLSRFQAVANDDQEYKAASGNLSFHSDPKLGVHLKGLCVGHDNHSDKTNTQEMIVGRRDGRLDVRCFHQSCAVVRRKWQAAIEQRIVKPRPPNAKRVGVVVDERGRKVLEALRDPERTKLIVAPTGTGKTHGIVSVIAPLLDPASGNEDKFAIICASKDQMKQIAERFGEVLSTNDITQHGIDLIEARETMTVGDARSRRAIRPEGGTRVAITHFTYVSRRGFSKYYYAFLRFIDERTHVFVDEIDAFVQSQVFHRSLGNRYRATYRQGHVKNEMVTKCGMFHGFNNCLNCRMEKYQGYRVGIDRFQNATLEPVLEFMDGEKRRSLSHVELDDLTLEKFAVGPAEITLLRQAEVPGELTFDDPQEEDQHKAVEYREVINDYLRSAYLPTVHRARIRYDDDEISHEAVVAKYKSGEGKMPISADERRHIKFPSRACNVLTITGIDRRPLQHMARAKTFTGLSATLTALQERFLLDGLGDLKRISVDPATERRMDKIIIVGMSSRIPVDHIADHSWSFAGRLLRFRETRAKAERDYEVLERSDVEAKFGERMTKFWTNSEGGGAHAVLLSYAFSSLGRGVDLPYDVVDVNASVYKPSSAYPAGDADSLQEQMQSDRMSTVAQNVGRVLRRTGGAERQVRVIVVEELEEESELRLLAANVETMSIEPIASWWIPDFLEIDEICKWLTKICQGRALPSDIPRDASHLIATAARLIGEGCDRKELKLKLHWATVRKRLESPEAHRIEEELDRMLDARPPRIRKQRLQTPDKVAGRQQRRRAKIRELIAKGYSDAKIRSDMKVCDTRQGWSDEDRTWFEDVISEERQRGGAAGDRERSVPVTERR